MYALLISLVALVSYMSVLFLIALLRKNNGIADIGYGIAFVIVIATALMTAPPPSVPACILTILPFLWGVRLATRIYFKNHGKPEDFRYKAWREKWRKSFLFRSFFQVYMLQGAIAFIISLPVLFAIIYAAPSLSWPLFFAGVMLWLMGFFFESVGDYQLDRFISDGANKGRIMMRGLWNYSRHPNYFGESSMWFGIAVAASAISASPFSYLGFISPILITFLLLKVSGVPLLEKHWEGNTEWKAYAKRTSVFLPLLPK
jgi:steroid 5-alpha reductase family enzyme